ncbi:MAG: hypothetical protein KGI67_14025, partial [Pseudomonadota bacterium]|nr:hypothetical protein [Pseudomonadota bacterium]
MKVRKYNARTSRDALRQVREDLGPDAVILANRMVKGGVEVMAMAAADLAAQTPAAPARPLPLETSEDDVVVAPPGLFARHDSARRSLAGLGMETVVARREAAALARLASGPDPLFEPIPTAARLRSEQAAQPAPRRAPTLGLRPEPAPLAPPPASAPAVLRRRGERVAPEPGLAALAAPAAADVDRMAGEFDLLAMRHDPLMAALAEEVRTLGSMLGKPAVALPPEAAPGSAAAARSGPP